MPLLLLVAASAFALSPPKFNWVVGNSGGCGITSGNTVIVAPGPPSETPQYLGFNGSALVTFNDGCTNPQIYAVLTDGSYSLITIDMTTSCGGAPVQLNNAPASGIDNEVAFYGGNVQVQDNATPPTEMLERLGLKKGKIRLGKLSRFRVTRLQGQGTTTFGGLGTTYQVSSYPDPDASIFDVNPISGCVQVNYGGDQLQTVKSGQGEFIYSDCPEVQNWYYSDNDDHCPLPTVTTRGPRRSSGSPGGASRRGRR